MYATLCRKNRPQYDYNVFGGTLNSTLLFLLPRKTCLLKMIYVVMEKEIVRSRKLTSIPYC